MFRKGIMMTLIVALIFGQSVPTYAWSIGGAFKKAKNWTENAVDDASDWTENAVDDASNWTENAVDDASNWTENAVDDASNWTENAVDDATNWTENAYDDATNWTENAYDDATNWTENAVDDASNWTENAVDDATDWTGNALDDSSDWLDNAYGDSKVWLKRAYKDVDNFVDDLLRSNENLSELDLLPVLKMDMTTVTNVNNTVSGHYTYGLNVREKKLPADAEAALKATLKDIGLTNYWANYCISELSEASGQVSPGGYIADMLPYSMFYGDRVADAIDDVALSYGLIDIDPFADGIVPDSDVDGLSFTYQLNSETMQPDGHYLVMVTGLKYGLRDNFTVTLKSGEQIIPTTKKALNKEEVAFVAVVNNPKNLEVMYNNDFERPGDIAFEVADGIQDGINDLVPLGDPISNGARDDIKDVINNAAIILESKHTDKNGKEKKDTKEVSLNDVLGDGDMGVILTEAIYAIPVVGSVIKPIMKVSGGDDALASLIRKVINQTEVKSYAAYRNGAVYIKAYTSEAAMRAELTGAVEEASVNTETLAEKSGVEKPSYDDVESADEGTGEKVMSLSSEFATMPSAKKISGAFSLNRAYTDSIYAVSDDNKASLMLFNDVLFSNGTIESKITLYDSKANAVNQAGVVFRAVDSGMGDGSYYGYAVMLTPDRSGTKGSVSLISAAPNMNDVIAQKTMSISPRTVYDIKVVADGNKITIYVDDQKALSARDGAYGIGAVGFSNINVPAIYQNIEIAE
ncbi:hypothetical protein KHM83_15240 [Fusibacter paucivorans]|uniref:DUF1080 domain-containing protein n=1 Tax=Fusibacter paucivorans TaxID=76009 RepID=A0ABS5PS98_9FIRM|nr:hypothetical protein [Fusibacter paucivorans]MBS7528039.1 hypothetical protein [Fusibacter paucivorans]